MTILMIRHAHSCAVADTPPLPAQIAGHALCCQNCDSLPALLRCLQHAQRSRPAWIVIETGAANAEQWALQGAELCAALDALPAPYIEITRNDADTLDSHLHPQHAPAALICGGAADASRQLSLAIVARRLRAAEEA